MGFRFKVKHKESRFACTQDKLDDLRSGKYPRAAQDQAFLEEAREILLKSFRGNNAERALKVLSIDLGERGASASLFVGREFKKSFPLKIIKLDRLLESAPKAEKSKNKPANGTAEKAKGLNKEHIGRHFNDIAGKAADIAKRRSPKASDRDILRLEAWNKGEKMPPKTGEEKKPELGRHDLRRRFIHIRRMIRDWVRLNVSQIIKTAESENVDLIVFESLRNIKVPGRDKVDKKGDKSAKAFLSFGQVRKKVKEKAVERGMRVVAVPEFESSQHCAKCGKKQEDHGRWNKNKRKDRRFECEHAGCGNNCDSDENAAKVLAKVFWGDLILPERRKG